MRTLSPAPSYSPRVPAAPETTRSGPPVRMLAALFAGAVAISGFTLLREIDPFDEGLMLQAARRIAGGEVPYADFPWPYGPAQPYLLAALGESLVPWRAVRTLVDAGVAVTAYALVLREAGPRWALAAWAVAAFGMAQPTGPNPWAPALLLGLLAILAADAGRPAWAGVAAAAAAAWRPDFALYAAVGALVVLLLRRERVARFALAGAAAVVVAYLPFAVAAGPGDLWDELVSTSLRESDYWSLPFPLAFDQQFRVWPPRDLAEDLKDLLGFYVPLVLVAGLAAAVLSLGRRPPPLAAGLAAAGVGYLVYLLSRTDEFHATPLLVVLGCALPLLLARGRHALLALPLVLLAGYGVANRASALVLPPELDAIDAPAADGVRTRPAEAAALSAAVAIVRARTRADDPVYVAPVRSDLVRIGNPLFYVLADRDNATRRDFGLLSRAGEQRQAIADLERSRPGVIVRWTDPVSVEREPNLRGRPSGVRLLDRWIDDRYAPLRTVGHYELLVPR